MDLASQPEVVGTIEVGLLLLLVSILGERILIAFGIVRGNFVALIIAAAIGASSKQLLQLGGPLYAYLLFYAFIVPIGANRFDAAHAISQGRWWWKKPDGESKDRSHGEASGK